MALLALMNLAGCQRAENYQSGFLAMGTEVAVTLETDDPTRAATLVSQLERDMNHWGSEWYPWSSPAPDGELKRLNAALAAGERVVISPALKSLLTQAKSLSAASDGYFDPAVAPMVEAWGFDRAERAASLPVPNTTQLTTWQARRPTLHDLQLSERGNDHFAFSTRRDLKLDLGALGKGYVIHLAMTQLQIAGIRNAMINAGGKISVIGTQQGQPWVVALRDPRAATPLATVKIHHGESVATSGDYERFAVIDGQRIQHVLDPHTGAPVTHTLGVTVLARDATLADAASTALMAAGPGEWQRIARQMGIQHALRVDASGAIEVSAALYARLRWNPAALQAHAITQVTL